MQFDENLHLLAYMNFAGLDFDFAAISAYLLALFCCFLYFTIVVANLFRIYSDYLPFIFESLRILLREALTVLIHIVEVTVVLFLLKFTISTAISTLYIPVVAILTSFMYRLLA